MIVGGVGLTTVGPRGRHELDKVYWEYNMMTCILTTTGLNFYQGAFSLIWPPKRSLPGTRGLLVVVGACWTAVVVSGGCLTEIITFQLRQNKKNEVKRGKKWSHVSPGVLSLKGKEQR